MEQSRSTYDVARSTYLQNSSTQHFAHAYTLKHAHHVSACIYVSNATRAQVAFIDGDFLSTPLSIFAVIHSAESADGETSSCALEASSAESLMRHFPGDALLARVPTEPRMDVSTSRVLLFPLCRLIFIQASPSPDLVPWSLKRFAIALVRVGLRKRFNDITHIHHTSTAAESVQQASLHAHKI